MDVTLIPGIMRHHNWTVGARLMESWFSRTVAVKPAYNTPPELVSIEWALLYAPVKRLYNEIIGNKIWSNEAGRKEVRKMLEKKGALMSGSFFNNFGDLSKSAADLDAEAVNFRATGGYYYYEYYSIYNDLDDLTAALGRFVLKVAIAGSVENSPIPGQFKVSVDEVGVFIKDSYDFEGDQRLGYWDADDNSVSAINFLSGDRVDNEDFRDWRAANGRGGDFQVFSDVKRVKLSSPDVFYV